MSGSFQQPMIEGNSPATPALPGELSAVGLASSGPKKRRLHPQVIVFGLVLVVSAVSLITMRRLGMREGIKMAEAELPLSFKDTKEEATKAATYERIMADLQRVQRPLDVALTEFGKSPFMLAAPAVVADPVTAKVDPDKLAADAKKRELELQRQKIAQSFSQLKLQSTLLGRVPLARINGDMLRAGESVGEHFVIKEIRDREVELTCGPDVFLLKMDPDEAPPPGKSKP